MAASFFVTGLRQPAVRQLTCLGGMSSPFASLLTELGELLSAVDLDTAREYDSVVAGGVPLREALISSAGAVAREAARFVVVVRTTRDASALPSLALELARAAAALVSAAQLLTAPGRCGTTLRADIRGAVRACLRALHAMISPLVAAVDAGASVATALRAHADALLHQAGMVLRTCDTVVKIPASDLNAVRRRLLLTARLVKESIQEICTDHSLDLTSLAPALSEAALSEGTGEAALSASLSAVTMQPMSDSCSNQGGSMPAVSHEDKPPSDGEEGDTDEERESADDEEALAPDTARLLLSCGLHAFKSVMRVLKHALAAADALAARHSALQLQPTSASPGGHGSVEGDALQRCQGSTDALSGLDSLAAAAQSLHDAIIDAAAGLNDVDVVAVRDASFCDAVEAIMAAAQRGRAACRGSPQMEALENALGEVQAGKIAAVAHWASALHVIAAAPTGQ